MSLINNPASRHPLSAGIPFVRRESCAIRDVAGGNPSGRSVINSEPRRNSSLELLRILSMIAIIGYHFYTQTAIGSADDSSVSACTAMFLGAFGRTGVNVFVIIGAWFLIDMRFKSMRLIRLYVPCFCYGLAITLVIVLTGHTAKDRKSVV